MESIASKTSSILSRRMLNMDDIVELLCAIFFLSNFAVIAMFVYVALFGHR